MRFDLFSPAANRRRGGVKKINLKTKADASAIRLAIQVETRKIRATKKQFEHKSQVKAPIPITIEFLKATWLEDLRFARSGRHQISNHFFTANRQVFGVGVI